MATKREILEQLQRGEGCLGRAGDYEQLFILRGHDPDAAALVREWARRRALRIIADEKPAEDLEQVRDALVIAKQIEIDQLVAVAPPGSYVPPKCGTCFEDKDFCTRDDCPGVPF
jgi:GGDEF domain-containing protein